MKHQDDSVVLSVILITYNHEPFIVKALDSVLMQRTNFDFEIIIAEDCSTDNSRTIIRAYQDKYPGKFHVIFRNKNVGARQNIIEAESLCKGRYFAMLETDDFWRDPNKLQLQIDFMESNPDYAVCYHDGNIIDEEEKIIREHEFDIRQDWTDTELISGKGYATTNTALYRNVISDDFRNHFVFNGDTLRWHLLGFYGHCKYLGNILPSAYRFHTGGMWSLLDRRKKLLNLLDTFGDIRKNIIEKCGEKSQELKLHDQLYFDIFTSYLIDSIKNKNLVEYLYYVYQLVKYMKWKAFVIYGYSIVTIVKKLINKSIIAMQNS